ncbi:hypothetical protein BCV70DRAFT_197051 [Testicularia cyperi]|uniref:Response regulatory domain-containing protein n=1 Tax=Testicularia cyperi TaxID=1882483 RepID=A0A317XXY7_9BASI|nr:hypothetical protein BCV70DRAFT_197051 [Testicularia cyperi]
MSTASRHVASLLNGSSDNQNGGSSDLNFTSSSESNDRPHSSSNDAPQLSASTFQWPSEPLNRGKPSLPQESQQMVDDANREISDQISSADQNANIQATQQQSDHPGLSKPRLSAQLAATLDTLEDERRQQLSPTVNKATTLSTSPLAALSPMAQQMQRSSSAGTSKSTGSDTASKTDSNQYPSILPEILQSTVTMPLNLLHSLLPSEVLSASSHEGLSASTMQVPMTSVNAILEACKALEWVAKKSAGLEASGNDRSANTRRNSLAQQSTDDGTEFTQFDIFELVQRIADVVSGVAAARGIDLVLDLHPELHGEPGPQQLNYKLGSCSIWAERCALNFLFMNCLAKVVHAAPVHSTVVIRITLTERDDTVVSDMDTPDMKLMVLTLGIQLITPPGAPPIDKGQSVLCEPVSTVLLDVFGASLVVENGVKGETEAAASRHAIYHGISVSVGKTPATKSDSQIQTDTQQDDSDKDARAEYSPSEEKLSQFTKELNGKKVALYSSSRSGFAKQLNALLSRFGCSIASVFTDSPDEDSFSGSESVFGRSTHTAVALTGGRPTLVSYNSDLDRRSHSAPDAGSHPSDPASKSNSGPSGDASDKEADTAVLDPVTGVPVTFNNSMLSDASKTTLTESAGPPSGSTPSANDRPGPDTSTSKDRIVPFSFVIIDDDIVTLQKELLRIRSAVPLLKSALGSKSIQMDHDEQQQTAAPSRPPLHHRTKSSPQIDRILAQHPEAQQPRSFTSLGHAMTNSANEHAADESVTQTIIFFTSMRSYRIVRDTVQPIIDSASFRGVASPPEIMVLPKPASIRRILTALYAAEKKPVVDLPFLPIATSPLSPLTTHSKSWWTQRSSPTAHTEGAVMTLTRRQTQSTDADTEMDTAPPTPWSPIDSGPTSQIPSPKFPLTSENLPLLNESNRTVSSSRSAGIRSHRTQDTAREATHGAEKADFDSATSTAGGAAPSVKSAARPSQRTSNVSNVQVGSNNDLSSAQKGSQATSAPPSVASASATASSSAHHSRSHPVSSPMPADALEYFSETAAKMGGSASSGMVIQSPDGRPAGIFFQPKASNSTTGSSSASSKPALSRGVSNSSVRRSSGTASSEHDDANASNAASATGAPGSRDRRLTNRSSNSSSHSMRSFADLSNAHQLSNTSSSASLDQRGITVRSASSADVATPGSQQSASAAVTKYPTGSMFAPQVGIHSVLHGDRPPVATPLNNGASQGSQSVSSPTRSHLSAVPEVSESTTKPVSDNNATRPSSDPGLQSNGARAAGPTSNASVGQTTPPNKPKVSTSGAKAAAATRKAAASKASGKSTGTSSPVTPVSTGSVAPAGNSTAATRLLARQSFAASPSDAKTKPSAVPQPGFMMGMGFTSSARRGKGPKKAPVREAVLPPIKVLIVEDNPINQRILSMFMGKKKIKYDVANNGREAVDKWKTGGYHLILMDIQLPVMDGISATKEIRKLERNANIGILPNTPPANGDSRAKLEPEPTKTAGSSPSKSTNVLSSQGLIKYPVGGPLTSSSSSTKETPGAGAGPAGGSRALVNGTGKDGRVPAPVSSGSINPFRASVIIVALTASVLSSDRVEALAAGCNDFLNKPVSLPWLNQKILEWGSMMYLMYSGLSTSEPTHVQTKGAGDAGSKAQLHLGFGYGPAEKAKVLASNLHLADPSSMKKKKALQNQQQQQQQQTRKQQQQRKESQLKQKAGQQHNKSGQISHADNVAAARKDPVHANPDSVQQTTSASTGPKDDEHRPSDPPTS